MSNKCLPVHCLFTPSLWKQYSNKWCAHARVSWVCVYLVCPPPPPCYFSMLYRYFPSFLASFISICTNKHTHPYPESMPKCAVTVIPGYTPTYYNFRGWHGDAETGSSSEPEIIHFRQRVVILTASVSKSSRYSPLWKSIRLLWEG